MFLQLQGFTGTEQETEGGGRMGFRKTKPPPSPSEEMLSLLWGRGGSSELHRS